MSATGCATANGAMAKYFLHVKVFSRGQGSRVTRAAAYRAGERIRDERTSEVYNYSDRQDVLHKEIVLASQFAGRTDTNWARDRAALWNAAEHADRRNARLAREVLVILPRELAPAQRTELARTFARELAERYRSAVDLAVHEPRRDSDERHHHAHLLMTAREVTPEGLGRRTALELSGTERHARGLPPSKAELLWMRERWAQVTNQMLLDAGLRERVDHRSYQAQGIDREPLPPLPKKVYYAERASGRAHPVGEDIRARYRERVEARLAGRGALERVLQRQKAEGRRRALEDSAWKARLPVKISRASLTREELNRLRRELYRVTAAEHNRKRREYRRVGQGPCRRGEPPAARGLPQEGRGACSGPARRADRADAACAAGGGRGAGKAGAGSSRAAAGIAYSRGVGPTVAQVSRARRTLADCRGVGAKMGRVARAPELCRGGCEQPGRERRRKNRFPG
ncbi:MAG: hypothetical protein E6K29_19465 [Gammaproteobacteria bacterium]|nr:MAG: hypothetical protein E6K29_19465 [Gammaproteobacteria bacterium]